jgi:hypothetical protein
MKPNINSVEVHPQLSNNGHLVNGKVKPKAAGFHWNKGLLHEAQPSAGLNLVKPMSTVKTCSKFLLKFSFP